MSNQPTNTLESPEPPVHAPTVRADILAFVLSASLAAALVLSMLS